MYKAVIDSWRIATTGQYNRVAGLTLVVWDTLLTHEDERKFFWKNRHSWPTYLFFWSRYSPMFLNTFGYIVTSMPDMTDKSFLKAKSAGYVWLVMEGWSVLSILWSISFILQLRIWALYNHSRIIGIFLITCSLVQVTVVSVFCGLGARDSRVEVERMGYLRRCKITAIPNFMTGYWISLLCLEAILCCLTLVKAIGHYLHTSCVRRERLRYVLLRDSLLYSFLSAAIYIYCLVNWLQNLADSLDATTGLAIAIPCVMAGRMMINIRKVYSETLTGVTQEEHELAIMFRESTATVPTATLACI